MTMKHPAADGEHLTLVQSLFVQHMPALRGFVLSLVGDFNLVDDIIQETFLTVNAKAGEFQSGTNFRAWVWTIARFKILQTLESQSSHKEQHLSPAVIDALCAHEGTEEWFTEDQIRHLVHCFDRLAPKARRSIELRYLHALRPPEIARLMSWTVEAVHVTLSRARVVLRDCVTRRMAAEG